MGCGSASLPAPAPVPQAEQAGASPGSRDGRQKGDPRCGVERVADGEEQ